MPGNIWGSLNGLMYIYIRHRGETPRHSEATFIGQAGINAIYAVGLIRTMLKQVEMSD